MTKLKVVLRHTNRAAAVVGALVIATMTGASIGVYNAPTDNHQFLRAAAVPAHVTQMNADPLAWVPQPLLRANVVDAARSVAESAVEKVGTEERCLAEAIYYEARGEGVQGQMAVAEVIYHRMHHRGYPGSICGVVHQGENEGTACQFSFVCNGEMLHRKSMADWSHARALAAKIITGIVHLGNSTEGATSYHAVYVDPNWSSSLEPTVQIGNHIFYKPLPRTRES